jgi:HK97 family phage major capsid protein
MNERLRALRKKREAKLAEAKAIQPEAEAEELTDEQYEAKGALIEEIKALDGKIAIEQSEADAERNAPAMEFDEDARITGRDRREDDAKCGFKSFGEFAQCVTAACQRVGAVEDERLRIAAAVPGSAANEGSGQDGGYAVPPEYREEIMQAVNSEDSLFSRTDQIPISRTSVKFPVDETTDWQTSGGIQVAWEDELNQLTGTKPKLDMVEWNARKVTALCPISNELLEDSTAMDGYIRSRAPRKMNFAVDLAILQGNGVGRPLGLLNSPALITVAKEGSQTADTIVRENIDQMWMRMPAQNRRNAVWIVNQDIEAQLQNLKFTGTDSPVPVYLPAGGYSSSPYDTLKGRPVLYHQAASTLGDKGDISLVDMSQYATVVKQGGIRVDTSMHLYFDADAMAFRFIMRVGGHPWLSSPIQPRVGSNTLSPFVTLAERA